MMDNKLLLKWTRRLARTAIRVLLIGLFVFSAMQILNGHWISYNHERVPIVAVNVAKVHGVGKLVAPRTNLLPGAP